MHRVEVAAGKFEYVSLCCVCARSGLRGLIAERSLIWNRQFVRWARGLRKNLPGMWIKINE